MFLIPNNFIQNIGQSLGSLLTTKTTPTFSVGGNSQLTSPVPAPAPAYFISDQIQNLITKPVPAPAPYLSDQTQTLINSSTITKAIVNIEPASLPLQFPIIKPLIGSPSNGFFTPPQSTYNEVKTPIVYIAPPPPPPAAPPIDIFLSKIRFSTPFYNSDEISDILTELISDDELLKAVFALEKAHFSAIVYLAVERLVDGEDIRALVEMRYETRNDLLLNYLKREADDIYVFRNFFKIMSNLMANPISKSVISVESDISVPNINSTVSDELYSYVRALISKYNKEDPFSNVNISGLTFSPEAYEQFTSTEEESVIINNIKDLFPKTRIMNSKKFFSGVFNEAYSTIINKLFENRLVNNYVIPESYIDSAIKFGSVQASTETSLSSKYFLKLCEAYGLSAPAINETIAHNFSYIDDNMLKSIVEKVFPNGEYFNRSSKFYMGKRLISFERSINTYDELSYTSVNADSLGTINLALNNNYVIAKDNGEVISFGKKNYTRLMINTLFDAMRGASLQNYAYNEIDKLTFSQITTYLNSVKSTVETFINNSFENSLYTESETLFMMFFKDIFSQYIEYLKNNNITSNFKPTLSVSNRNKYKLLNTIQQTFIFIPELIRRISSNEQYITLEKTLIVGYNEASSSSYMRYLRGI
jgi:hypothetical protein